MKTFSKLLLFALISIAFANCNKDEASFDNLAGEWRMTDIHSNNGVSTFSGITSTVEYHGTEYNTVTTFTENPNEFSSTGSYTFEITTTTIGIPFTQEVTVDAFSGTGQWSIDGDVLTQVFAGTTTLLDILELTDSRMRLQQEVDVTLNGVHNTATVFTTFERI